MLTNSDLERSKNHPIYATQEKFRSYWSANPFKMYSHLPRLCAWYQGKDIYPISIEIGLTSRCNHDCCWCSIKAKHVARSHNMPEELLESFAKEIGEMDVRSVVISGSGEQTLHPYFPMFIRRLSENGIHIGIDTNGSCLTTPICEAIVRYVTWLRVSLDAASEDVRKSVHGVADLKNAVEGIKRLVTLRRKAANQLAIGTQMVVCPENQSEIEACARLSASLGVDYHQIKPVVPFDYFYPEWKNKSGEILKWLARVKEVSNRFSQNGFVVNIRHDQFIACCDNNPGMRSITAGHCLTSFSPYVEADGSVWYCVDKKGCSEYYLGNLNSETLKTIWGSKRRKDVLEFVKKNPCGHICRNSPLNEFLWEIKNPTPFYDFL